MIEQLAIVLLMALVATGAYIIQQEGMILHRLTKLWSLLPAFWQKPLWTCPPCICSVWGIPTWFICSDLPLMYLPVHVIGAASMAAMLSKYLDI